MIKKIYVFVYLQFFFLLILNAQAIPKGGKLFIIGGGKRSSQLMQTMLSAAQLGKKDYIAVLPMASSEPDTAFYYSKASLDHLCTNTIANLNFTKEKQQDRAWLDSLEHAKLIFIAGGDQERFMKSVMATPVYWAIHKAYDNGATIAGTSAGAAVMSKFMITGNELSGDTTYHETFRKVRNNNIEIHEGLGLLANAIIDQHFIVRSRYNRLLTALAKFPYLICIGIDEATAIIVQANNVFVTGESQVIVLSDPEGLKITDNGLIKYKNIRFSIYTSGDSFVLK